MEDRESRLFRDARFCILHPRFSILTFSILYPRFSILYPRFSILVLRARFSILAFSLLLLSVSAPQAQSNDRVTKSRRAKEAMASGQFEQAIPMYSELVKALPQDAGMRMNLAMAQFMAGHPAKAIPDFEAALKLQPKLVAAWQFLGAAHLQLGEPVKAVEPLRKVLASQPDNRDARQMLGEAFLSLQRYEQAADQFRALSQKDPSNAKAWYGLGRSHEALSRRAFEELEKSAPDSPYNALLVAEVLAKQQRYANAFYFYRQAADKLSRSRDIHEVLAEIYRKTGHADWAAVEEEKARQIPLPDCRPRISRIERMKEGAGVTLNRESLECDFRAGRYLTLVVSAKRQKTAESTYWLARAYNEMAVEAFSRLAKLPPSVETLELRAEIYRNQGRHQEAVDQLREALKLSPDSFSLQKELAEALYLSRDYQAVQSLLDDLLKREPDSPELNFLYGDTLVQSQQLENGIPFLEKAVQDDPKLLPAHASLGRAYLQSGQAEKSIPHLKLALETDEDGSLHYQLARAYQITGQTELAKKALQKYQEIQKAFQAQKQKTEQDVQITPP